MEPANQLVTLFRKFLADDYTAAEFRQLQEYFRTEGHAEQIKQLITEAMNNGKPAIDFADDDLDDLLERVDARLSNDIFPRRSLLIRKTRWLSYAAAVLAVAMLGTWAYLSDSLQGTNGSVELAQVDVAPGTNRATLSLSDGTTVELESTQHGIVMGADVAYTDGSRVWAAGQLPADAQPKSLTLSTPNGGTYQITLHDGTTVWLNSSSTLTYPSHFDGHERVVHLVGEAYFEVKPQRAATQEKSAVPFKVVTDGKTIQVLGTEFNVSAYPDKAEIKTTLVNGMVEVAAAHGATATKLRPGQQAIMGADDLRVIDVDVRPFIGWKDGVFYFDRTPLAEAMEALSRWYDVEISYEGSIPKTHFYGEISRDKPLSEVLAVLKEGGDNFRIEATEGRSRLVVSKK